MSDPAALTAAVSDAATGDAPAAIALMRVLIEAPDEAKARAALDRAIAVHAATSDAGAAARLRSVAALWRAHPDAWRVVRRTIAGVEHGEGAAPASPRAWAETFDRLVAVSPEASVALYSLGDARLLAAATDEIVAAMARWGLLAPDRDALDLGCGIGRFVAALAPELHGVTGLDVSGRMIAEARRRCAALQNVRLAESSGLDLAPVADASVDVVLAADVFPYVVQAGSSALRANWAEIGRVLRPGGHVLILNYSYRGDLPRDRAEVAAAAEELDLAVLRCGTRDFQHWDGVTFLLRRT